ncbi:MAG: lipoate--protein ligase family protein [Thermoleophilia bacterium]|nr:lipoate--protein ligase family protein [Thermoleophilia bacterium]
MHSELELLHEAFPERPEAGPALSRILLDQVADGRRGPTVRLSRPGRVVAFGRRDTRSRGYAGAVASARECGFAAMERLTGGRAAAYSEGTLSLTLTTPDPDPGRRTGRRFEEAADLLRAALASLGVDARIGEIPGEYCPGTYSVSAGGRAKLAGIGQRMVKGAAHVGFVIVVSGSDRIRAVLDPVYRALELEWRPETVGAVEDEVEGAGLDSVEAAILDQIASQVSLRPVALDRGTLELAETAAPKFRSPG